MAWAAGDFLSSPLQTFAKLPKRNSGFSQTRNVLKRSNKSSVGVGLVGGLISAQPAVSVFILYNFGLSSTNVCLCNGCFCHLVGWSMVGHGLPSRGFVIALFVLLGGHHGGGCCCEGCHRNGSQLFNRSVLPFIWEIEIAFNRSAAINCLKQD